MAVPDGGEDPEPIPLGFIGPVGRGIHDVGLLEKHGGGLAWIRVSAPLSRRGRETARVTVYVDNGASTILAPALSGAIARIPCSHLDQALFLRGHTW